MHLTYRNVNDAFTGLVRGIHEGSIPTEVLPSRYGEVMCIEEPVIVTYTHPTERVLFNTARNANPFFHAYEALWMLAGRNDVVPLAYYNSRMAEFSDDGQTFNGAYGYRWRKTEAQTGPSYLDRSSVDQLPIIINHLKAKPESRRAVLQMWNVQDDLLKIDTSKDVSCNLSVCLSVEQGMCRMCNGTGTIEIMDKDGSPESYDCTYCDGMPHNQPRYLNMTVFNRSNDLIWGMLGANVVHFSILQEYMAAHLGLDVGRYNQVSNNLHAYTKNWEPEKWLAISGLQPTTDMSYPSGFPLIKNPTQFDGELYDFVEQNVSNDKGLTSQYYQEPFLDRVALPMFTAFHFYKDKDYQAAFHWIDRVEAKDWQLAGRQWLERRRDKKKGK